MNKQELIQRHLEAPYEVGETVYIQGLGSQNKSSWNNSTKIIDLNEEGVYIIEHRSKQFYPFSKVKKYTYDIGIDPVGKSWEKPRTVNFSLDSIMFTLGLDPESKKNTYTIEGVEVQSCSMNPFVFDSNGNKVYYQRPFVWSLEEKQLLIDSIYNGISIGTIVVRNRGWEEVTQLIKAGHTDVAFRDIVDGKQRLSTLVEFINNKFPDSNGFYWDDFSDQGKNHFFRDAGVSYAEYQENTSDKNILQGFLTINFAGVPQSKEHIEFVKSISI